jgi:hypothetical protein
MFANKTAVERAFDLARSGECRCISDLTQRLDREGYYSNQIYGPLLKKQLTSLIDEAKNAHAEDAADVSLDCGGGDLRRHRRSALGKCERLFPQTKEPRPLHKEVKAQQPPHTASARGAQPTTLATQPTL